LLAPLGPEISGADGIPLFSPVDVASTKTSLLPIPRRSGRAYLFDVLRCTPGASPERVAWILRDNRRIYESALEVGGALYPICAVQMSHLDWRNHFGARWDAFAAAKRRYDPDGTLGGSFAIFERPV